MGAQPVVRDPPNPHIHTCDVLSIPTVVLFSLQPGLTEPYIRFSQFQVALYLITVSSYHSFSQTIIFGRRVILRFLVWKGKKKKKKKQQAKHVLLVMKTEEGKRGWEFPSASSDRMFATSVVGMLLRNTDKLLIPRGKNYDDVPHLDWENYTHAAGDEEG